MTFPRNLELTMQLSLSTVWDISCVPGWTVTMAIEPEPEDCQSVICADDLNDNCPDDRLKQ